MTSPSARLRVLLVDDQALILEGNSLLIEATDDLAVAGTARNGEEAIAAAAALQPDVVLMDVRMPGMGGIEATRRIVATTPGTRVIVLTTFDVDEYAFGALDAGASAFVLKSSSPEALIEAIRTVASGDAVVEPRITKKLIDLYTSRVIPVGDTTSSDDVSRPLELLSPREYEVLLAIAQGLSNTEIADRMHVSAATVKSHINRMFAKLGFRDRAQAIIFAYRQGLSRRRE